jgi:hypothetical protein
MRVREGDRYRSKITGHEYEVREIRGRMVILQTENGKDQVITELNNLKLFYKKVEKKDV